MICCIVCSFSGSGNSCSEMISQNTDQFTTIRLKAAVPRWAYLFKKSQTLLSIRLLALRHLCFDNTAENMYYNPRIVHNWELRTKPQTLGSIKKMCVLPAVALLLYTTCRLFGRVSRMLKISQWEQLFIITKSRQPKTGLFDLFCSNFSVVFR